MEPIFTKGPWTFRDSKENERLPRYETRFKILCDTDIPNIKGIVASCGYKYNAKLISQAPEMVNILKCALADLWGWAMDNDLDLTGDYATCQTIREIKEVLKAVGVDTSDYEIDK